MIIPIRAPLQQTPPTKWLRHKQIQNGLEKKNPLVQADAPTRALGKPKEEKHALRIMPTGLLILSADLSRKYGTRP
jgi:hypothetical protein